MWRWRIPCSFVHFLFVDLAVCGTHRSITASSSSSSSSQQTAAAACAAALYIIVAASR